MKKIPPPIRSAMGMLERTKAMATNFKTITVPVKKAWASKVNWAQIFGFAATVLTALGYTVPPEIIPMAVAVVATVTQFVTLILRTFFSPDVVDQSV